jgi:hypothetical protein
MKMGKRQNNGLFVFDWFKMLLRILPTIALIRALHNDSKPERWGLCCSGAAGQNHLVLIYFKSNGMHSESNSKRLANSACVIRGASLIRNWGSQMIQNNTPEMTRAT